MTAAARPRRPRWLVPEVVQSSAMDCGPATLKSLLEGFGISASYGRLREACQTDVDGTSINAIEEAAVELGLEAEQLLMPADHLLLAEAEALPAIVALWLPGKLTHFVVAWRRHGGFVQVMDPSTGRRWPAVTRFLRQLYAHEMRVDAGEWLSWASSDGFTRPLRRRLIDLGVNRAEADRLIRRSVDRGGWLPVAALDATVRMVSGLVLAGALRGGRTATRVLCGLVEEGDGDPAAVQKCVPRSYWSASAVADDPHGDRLLLRGALLVSVRGPKPAPRVARPEDGRTTRRSKELAAALTEPPSRPGRDLLRLLRADGVWSPATLFLGTAIAACAVIVEALLFRGFLEAGRHFVLPEQRFAAAGLLAVFLVILLSLDVPIATGLLRAGRQLEARLRASFLHKVPRLGDRYFHSRLTSDMAERGHSVHTVRALPTLGGRVLQAAAELAVTALGIAWLDPRSAPAAAATALGILALPVLMHPALTERDLRFRVHTGALTRFVLDALLGLLPIRAHCAERAVRRQHEALLAEWGRAGLAVHALDAQLAAAQSLLGFGGAAWLLWAHLLRADEAASPLLMAYWALRLPLLGQEITTLVRQYPRRRNVTLRLLEPLGAPEEVTGSGSTALRPQACESDCGPGIAVTMENVAVRAAGHAILDEVNVSVSPGEEVAIVGPSGAGKSTLVGLLLGWHRPAMGRILVDGEPLEGEHLARLRRSTAWVDPAVQLWNRSLIDNLAYGLPLDAPPQLARAVDGAELLEVLERLPDGLRTSLGEGGGMVSGGEGQRVRLGRALLRPGTRLVILDEPFRGLDRRLRRELLKRLRSLWSGATFLCITHDVAETQDFDRVLVVEAGRLVDDGCPAQLAEDPRSHYHALLAAERRLHEELWSDPRWRRSWLEDGRLRTP